MNITDQSYIYAEQMILIDKKSTVSLIGGLITSIFFTVVLNGKVSSEVLFSLFAAISLVYVACFTLYDRNIYLKQSYESSMYERDHIYLTLLKKYGNKSVG